MGKRRRQDVPEDRSVVPSIEDREGRLKQMLEQAEEDARLQVREAEEQARRRL
jgi:vacuolar-type H+-ATPase subunit H